MNDLFQIRQTKDMGRGMFAIKDIQEGVKVLDLDMREYLMYVVVVEHVYFGRLSEMSQLNRKAQLAFYLAFADRYRRYQRHYSPKVIHYIDNLPHDYHSLICWQPHQLQMLVNKSLSQRAFLKRNFLYQQFIQIKSFLQQDNNDEQFIANFQNDFQSSHEEQTYFSYLQKKKFSAQSYYYSLGMITINNDSDETEPDEEIEKLDIKDYRKQSGKIKFEEFLRFYTAVETRCIYQENSYDSHSQLGALIPLVQLFNHSPSGQIIKDTYFIKTIKPIKKDEQIFITYGERSNQELFFNYGFIIDEDFQLIKNDYIRVEAIQQIQKRDVLQEKRCGEEEILVEKVKLKEQHRNQINQQKQNQTNQQKQNQINQYEKQLLTQHRAKLASKYNKYYHRQQGKLSIFH